MSTHERRTTSGNDAPIGTGDTYPLPVAGVIARATAAFTRPANTTTYAVDDIVSARSGSGSSLLTFADLVPAQVPAHANRRGGWIQSVRLATNSTNVTNGNFRLYLWQATVTQVGAIDDNAQFTALWANRENGLGFVDLQLSTGGTGSDMAAAEAGPVNLPFDVDSGNTVFGALVARAAYVPASGQQFHVVVRADRY